jgi:hypothetical protein
MLMFPVQVQVSICFHLSPPCATILTFFHTHFSLTQQKKDNSPENQKKTNQCLPENVKQDKQFHCNSKYFFFQTHSPQHSCWFFECIVIVIFVLFFFWLFFSRCYQPISSQSCWEKRTGLDPSGPSDPRNTTLP